MASLQSLPNEILVQIVESLESNKCAAAVAQTNRRFFTLCDLSTRRKYHQVRLESENDIHQAHAMLRSILQKPRLGLYVNHLRIVQSPLRGYYGFWDRSCQSSIDPQKAERLKLAVIKAGYDGTSDGSMILGLLQSEPNAVGQMTKCEMICWAQALATVLAVLSPNLQFIAMSYIWPRSTRMPYLVFTELLRKANGSTPVPYLQRLHTIHFLWGNEDYHSQAGGRCSEYNMFRESLEEVLSIPSLQSIRFDALIDGEYYQEAPLLRPRRARYSEVILNRSILSCDQQCEIIASARTLKAYTYSLGDNSDTDPDVLFQILLTHRDTLETLDLDIERESNMLGYLQRDRRDVSHLQSDDDDSDKEEEEDENENVIHSDSGSDRKVYAQIQYEGRHSGSLQSFCQLKHLSLGPHLLYHYARGIGEGANIDDSFSLVDSLPQSLETLRIYGFDIHEPPKMVRGKVCEYDVQHRMIDLMANKAKLPRLKVLEGVEEMIPVAERINDPTDENADLLWRPDEGNWEDWERFEF